MTHRIAKVPRGGDAAARRRAEETASALAVAHGTFNLVGGLWPLLHRRSFEWFFGPKRDGWLQHTVGGLLVVNGLAQLRGADAPDGRAVARLVGLGTAATLLTIDLVYVPKGRIRPTYLCDAVLEVCWIRAWLRQSAASAQADRRT